MGEVEYEEIVVKHDEISTLKHPDPARGTPHRLDHDVMSRAPFVRRHTRMCINEFKS
jgi:hypothetical protein